MLKNRSYVFIIGAGAGKPYGFPLGYELYELICNNYLRLVRRHYNYDDHVMDSNTKRASDFVNELGLTTGISIDRYINYNEKFKEEGVYAIASQIYANEQSSNLPWRHNVDNDWYTYLYQKLIEGFNNLDELLKISENKISFITFNYDRSLEHFLFENFYGLIKNTRKFSDLRKKTAEIISKINFIHVYGQVGLLPWQNGIYNEHPDFLQYAKPNIVRYGHDDESAFGVGLKAKDMIDVMYASRKDNADLDKARNLSNKLIESCF